MTNELIYLDRKEWEAVLAQGDAAWLDFLFDKMLTAQGGSISGENMDKLTTEQLTLYAYKIFRDEMLEGGFCQLIQNGYGPFIFENPFTKIMKDWGLRDFAKILNKANAIYRKYKEDLTCERTEDEFMAMYEQYEDFDRWEDDYIEDEEKITEAVKEYVLAHSESFYDFKG